MMEVTTSGKVTGQGHGTPEPVRKESERVGFHGPSAGDHSAPMVEPQAMVLDTATGMNEEEGKGSENPFLKSRKTARSPTRAVKSVNEQTFYNAWKQAEKEKLELKTMCQQMKKQIEELQLELAEIKKQTVPESHCRNSEPQTPYYTDEEELDEEIGWLEQRGKKRKTPGDSPPGNPAPGNSLQQDTQVQQNSTKKMRQKPPPIIIDKKESYGNIYRLLATNGFVVKSKLLSTKETKINLEEEEAYRRVTGIFNEKGISWHSYENKLDRPIRVIAKGISPTFDTEMIKNDLYQRKYKIINVENILKKTVTENRKTNIKLPVHMLTFSKEEDINKIYEIKDILGMRVEIQSVKRPKLIPQCKRCQEFGHTQKYCHKVPKCVRCAEQHFTKECSKSKQNTPICANCGEKHPANYRGCKVAVTLQKIRDQTVGKKKEAVKGRVLGIQVQAHERDIRQNVIESATIKQQQSNGAAHTNKKQDVIKNSTEVNQTWSDIVKRNNKVHSSNVEEMLLKIMACLDKQEKSQEDFKKDIMARLITLENANRKAVQRQKHGSRH